MAPDPFTSEDRVEKLAKMARLELESDKGRSMKCMSAKDAKYGFGRLIDLARAEPVVVEKHGRPVVVVLAIEQYELLKEGKGIASQEREHALQASGLTSVDPT